MKRFEIGIDILNPDYTDSLIVALARQGYSPYFNDSPEFGKHGSVFFSVYMDQVREIIK